MTDEVKKILEDLRTVSLTLRVFVRDDTERAVELSDSLMQAADRIKDLEHRVAIGLEIAKYTKCYHLCPEEAEYLCGQCESLHKLIGDLERE